jgi:RNA polymerase sigma factor (sigma-70 family)
MPMKNDLENLTEKFKTLVYKITGKYVAGFPDKADDIIGAAMLGLCEGITQAIKQKKEEANVPGYIYINVHKEIINFLIADKTIRIPRSYIKKMKMEAFEAGQLDNFSVQDLFPKLFSLAKHNYDDWKIASNDALWFEVFDVMNWLELDELERKVVWGKIEGYTYRELAEQLNCSAMWPNLVMKGIREKWQKKEKRERY